MVQNPYSISLPYRINSKMNAVSKNTDQINVSILKAVSVQNLSNLIKTEAA